MEAASTKPQAASADQHRAEPQADIALGMIVAPGLARDVTAKVASELAHDLEALDLGIEWRTELTVDRLVSPPAQTTEIIDAARRKLLDANWDLGVVVTDLPLRVGRRPVSRQVSPTHGIAVVSLPALGALHLAPRLRRTLLELVGELVGDGGEQWSGDGALARLKRRWGRGVLQELATDTADRPGALRFLSSRRFLRATFASCSEWCGQTAPGAWRLGSTARCWRRSWPAPTASSPPTSGGSRRRRGRRDSRSCPSRRSRSRAER